MDDKWIEQAQQDRHQMDDQGWLSRLRLEGRNSKTPDSNDFPTGEPHWMIRSPALVVLPVMTFGSCLFTLTMIWLSAGR
jgi:hypothetical protein